MVEDRVKKTIEYYDRDAKDWTNARKDRSAFWKVELERFHDLLPSGRVLEIGSGSGHDAELLIAKGYDYVGTDASKTFLRIASERNPEAKFVHAAVNELDDSLGVFDGFWSAATLLHIPKKEIDTALFIIGRRIKAGGIGFITMKEGEGEEEDQETGRWFAYYGQDEFGEILERNGFSIIESNVREGDKNTWLVFYVKKKQFRDP